MLEAIDNIPAYKKQGENSALNSFLMEMLSQ